MKKIGIKKFFLDKAFLVGVILFIAWVGIGVYLFAMDPFEYSWSRGEVGDFLNGLGGIALVIIGPTALWQYVQLKEQQKQAYEEGVFRTFETLKPELENISVRVVAKSVKKLPDVSKILEGEQFEDLRDLFWRVDRTVFLRTMQKKEFIGYLEKCVLEGDEDVKESLGRFGGMMLFLNNYVDRENEYIEQDFKQALQSTEVFTTYNRLRSSNAISGAMHPLEASK